MRKKGFFLVFEGIDGCGKSLQVELLRKRLGGRKTVFTAEHTRGVVGELIERIVNKKEVKLNLVALQLLFVADRVDHWQRVIGPGLKKGKTVISDRYFWSTVAYGSLVTDRDWLLTVNSVCPLPDLVIFFDIRPELALERIGKRGEEKSIFEAKEKLEKVRESYLWLAEKFKETAVVVDGSSSPQEIHRQILEIIQEKR